MVTLRISLVLTFVNLVLLALQFARGNMLGTEPVSAMVRTRAFELLDEKNRVRAEFRGFPPQPELKMPDGTVGHPEVVQLRLINADGGPRVKLVTYNDGAGLYLGGESGGYVQIHSRGANPPVMKLTGKDGQERSFTP